MRAVVQRVRSASVLVDDQVSGSIERGLLVFLGVGEGDGQDDVRYLAEKVLGLRIFPDEKHSMNVSVQDIHGEILLISQFTLYGDCRRGRRPSFDAAEDPDRAKQIYEDFAAYLTTRGYPPKLGVFAASMLVTLENDGPVTMLLDSKKDF